MEESNSEVAVGVNLANQSGQALFEMIEAVETVYNRAGNTVISAHEMMEASNKLVSAMNAVSAVVDENTTVSYNMTTSTGEVSRSIDEIVAINAENRAAIERAANLAMGINAEVEDVTATAGSLGNGTRALRELVARFEG